MRVSRVAAHTDDAAIFASKILHTEKHSTRQHNLPITATDAVDVVSSVTVVDLQPDSKDPKVDCRNREELHFIYKVTVKWAELSVASRKIHTWLLSVGHPLGSSLLGPYPHIPSV